MVGAEDRLRDRLAGIRKRLDAIDAAADEEDREYTEAEYRERKDLVAEARGLNEKMREIERERDVRSADWLERRDLSGPGALAEGEAATFDDGDRINADGHTRRRPATAIVGYTDDGKEVRILESSETLSKSGEIESSRGRIGAWIRGSLTGDWREMQRFAGTEMTGYSQTEAGVLLDSTILIDLARAKSRVIEAGARTVPMTEREITIARITAEPSGQWRSENKSVTIEKLAVDGVTLKARTRMILVEVPNEVVEDTVLGGRVLEDAMAAQLGLEMDRVAMFGVGSAEEPLGLENHGDIKTITGIGALTNYDDFSNAVEDVQESNGEPSAVIFSPRTAGALDRLKATDNQPLQPPASFANLRKLPTRQVPDDRGAGSDESLAFVGDWSHLWIGIRLGIRLDRSPHSGFTKNMTVFRGTMRLDVVATRPDHFVLLSGITV